MSDMIAIAPEVVRKRRLMKLSQAELARKARISRATLDAFENQRGGDLGFSKLNRILAALGLELRLQEAASRRPTLDELREEDRDDQSLDRRG
jgi:transcriptional regulator with XRE-family HTH domain